MNYFIEFSFFFIICRLQATRSLARSAVRGRMVVVAAAADRPLWAPGVQPPSYLNGTLPGECLWGVMVVAPVHCSCLASARISKNLTRQSIFSF